MGNTKSGAEFVLGLMVRRVTPTPLDALLRAYAPSSVVVGPCEPVGRPLLIQLANRAASNQLTNVIGRLVALLAPTGVPPAGAIALYVNAPALPLRTMPAEFGLLCMLVL